VRQDLQGSHHRSFRQAVDYTENRKVKNSRQARAMAKGTKFGRQAQEAAWQSAEVDALYRLAAAGVRVPKPYNFFEGVLLMELVTDAEGDAAPRLNDVAFTPEQARPPCHADARGGAHAVRRRGAWRPVGVQHPGAAPMAR
jgi:RIO kinase 1